MALIPWVQVTEAVVGRGHAVLQDVANRALRYILTISGYDPDAVFPGLFGPVYNVIAYGAKADYNGTSGTDSAPAFNAAVAAALLTGGRVIAPAGQYYLNAQVLGDMTLRWNRVLLDGYGAELFSGPAVTGSQIKLKSAPQPHGIVIRGFSGNHLGNTTAGAFIELSGCSHGVVEDIIVEHFNTKAGYASILLTSTTPGDDNTACFWTTIRNLKTRKRVTGGTNAAYDILLKGAHNATIIEACSFSHCNIAIAFVSDGVGTSVANGCVIDRNAFETIDSIAVQVVSTGTTDYTMPGLRVSNSRVESCPTFVSLETSNGAASLQHSSPPFLYGNFCTNGSVTTWLNNPTNQNVSVWESIAYGPFTGNVIRNMAPLRLIFNSAKPGANLLISDEGGISNWQRAHLQLGEDAVSPMHIWFNTGNGFLMCKAGAPTSATDGIVLAANGQITPFAGIDINASKGIRITESGGAATQGVATLVAGTKVVATTKVTANSRIYLMTNTPGGTPGWLQVSARVVGTSFTILSSSATDTSVVAWLLVEGI